MNSRPLALVATLTLMPWVAASGKPPPPARSAPLPSTTADDASASLLHWLLLQNGGPAAATVPWPEIVRAVSGRQITPLDPANALDAAVLAKLGTALDTILPRLNRPDGPLRATPALTTAEVNARIADELRTTLGNPAESLAVLGMSCPVLRWSDPAGGRPCYLVVAAYPVDGKDPVVRALTVRAADLAGQITADGACLLVGIEHNGKAGRDLALLNWEAIDLARVSLRCAVTFEADAAGLHAPGATLGDGRRGRD